MSDVEGPGSAVAGSGTSSNISPQTLAVRVKAAKAKVRQLAYDTIRMLLLNIDKKERFGYVSLKGFFHNNDFEAICGSFLVIYGRRVDT